MGFDMSGEVSRYYLVGSGRFANAVPVRPALLLGISVVLIIVSRSPIVIVVSAIFALIGVYALFRERDKRPGFFVELQEDYLLLNLLTEVKIPYGNIASAENPRFTQGPIGRWLGNAAVAWNHLFGGDFPRIGARGEVNTSVLVIRLKKYAWSFIPFPPFMVPKRRWRLMIDGAESLRAKLQERLLPVEPTTKIV